MVINMAKIVNGKPIPNMPWENCPQGFEGPIWKYSGNPVIKRNPNKTISRVFNSALVPFNGEYVGVFRGDGYDDVAHIYVGHSKDGVNIEIEDKRITFVDRDGNPIKETAYQYDPRLIPLNGKYYVVFCDEMGGPTITIAETTDFKTFVKLNTAFLPCNRNGVLFPRKINGKYYMLSRPSDNAHTAFGDIFISESNDLEYWGNHKRVAFAGCEWWCSTKIGAGPVPIETDEGWLVFIHGVSTTCNGFVYSIGALILDKDNPWIDKDRCSTYLMTQEESYETTGFVPNVTFPTSCLVDSDTGRIAIYYGAADTYTGIAFTTIERVMDYIKAHKR